MTIHSIAHAIVTALGAALALILLPAALHHSANAGPRYRKCILGAKLVPIKKLRKSCLEPSVAQVDVAGVPMPIHIETLHLLLSGADGSGISVPLRNIVSSAQRRGDRMLIVDPDGDLYSKFGRPDDVLLNPYDQRTEGWSVFNEAREDGDWMQLAGSAVPLRKGVNAEITRISRLLLGEVARKLYELGAPDAEALLRWCARACVKDLRAFLSGTPAESLVTGPYEASKVVTLARAALSETLSEHMHMPRGKFSIRDWMDTGAGNLYITWREDSQHAMKTLISTWADIFCWSLLAAPQDQEQRWWLVLQDIAALEKKITTLEDLLANGRERSVRAVVGLSSISQLRDVYGMRMSQSILESLGSRVVMRNSDPETAEAMATALGEQEVSWMDMSAGGEFSGFATVPAVLPDELRALPELTGYVAFAGNRPISKFVLEPMNFINRQPAFVEAKRVGAYAATSGATYEQLDSHPLPMDPTSRSG